MKLNAATLTDGYKVGHGNMYSEGVTSVYSNFTPRTDRIYRKTCSDFYDGKLVFVGAQGAIQEIVENWSESFFNKPKNEVIEKYASRMASYLGGKVKAIGHLAHLHDIGYLPLEFKCLTEGTKVPMGVPVLTVTNTDPECFWLVNYLETTISNLLWKPSTNATIAAEFKAICKHYAEKTGTDDFTVSIQCHDFSMRGMSGPEDSARSGFSHLTNFIGTDSLPAIDYAEDYYDASGLIAISVPATEHAVATSNILEVESTGLSRKDAEQEFMRQLITEKYPTGIVSYVADSFDYWTVITEIVPSLKHEILGRSANGASPGKLVLRPDSGDPVRVICGYEVLNPVTADYSETYATTIDGQWYEVKMADQGWTKVAPLTDAEVKGSIECLWEVFGGTLTETGHKLLDSHIGLIYGDSITIQRCNKILDLLERKGFASGNVVFGVGSYTYQMNTRDTFGFAQKCTHVVSNGVEIPVFKDPKTDSKKKSAKGLLKVEKQNGNYVLLDNVTNEEEASLGNELRTVWKDGVWHSRITLDQIRANLA